MQNLFFERKLSSENQAGTRILLCAHYDSRPRCDRDPDPDRRNDSLPGANDGGSGVAVLMELALIFDSVPPETSVDFAFFDGEDWGEQGDIDQYCLGSIEFAGQVPAMRYRFAILLDIVGHLDAKFYREGNSEKYARELNDHFWEIALEMRPNRFVDSVGISIMDDHIPLLGARIPTIDIIDLSYPQWHTSSDLPEYCDTTALSDIGEVVAELVYREKK
ncbi:MAG: M28 family peptidase [candidate division Zixibacteria bacterium]|nr:M28 family peptidase [candidate division Zixibacteria bacterium]